ncbi:puratrophin-1-like isoform X1 [Centruroides vittatus]|uniref:puratrophin-1-like isoform X1 n=2 Tax=Centruroides vittatus TaxID=120091 RepID=UPI0035102DC1
MASAVWTFFNRLCRKPIVKTPAEADQSEKEKHSSVISNVLHPVRGEELKRKFLSVECGFGIYRRQKTTLYYTADYQQSRTVLSTTLWSICDNSITRYMRTLDIHRNVGKVNNECGLKRKIGEKSRQEVNRFQSVDDGRGTNQMRMEARLYYGISHDVTTLAEQYLSSIYQPFRSVRKQLVKQCRDMLLVHYNGNHKRFMESFLGPASELLIKFKTKVSWPLCHAKRVVVQLGELDDHVLKPGDFYLCVHRVGRSILLSAQYKTETHVGRIGIHAPLFPMEWLSDQQLTSVLRCLLVSAEKGVERLKWHPAETPWHRIRATMVEAQVRECGEEKQRILAPLARPEEFNLEADVGDSDNIWNKIASAESADDGFCDNNDCSSPSLSDLDQELLHSRLVLLPGCRDTSGRSVVVIFISKLKGTSPRRLAQLLMYFYGIPKRDDVSDGFLVLVDGREATEAHWPLLDEAFSILESNVSRSVYRVLLWKCHFQEPFPTSGVKFESVWKEDKLEIYVKKDQLLQEFGGSYAYDHLEWIGFFKFFEPFLNGCRFSGHYLVTMLQELGVNLSSGLSGNLVDQHRNRINQTFQDEQLRHLEDEGETILAELKSYGISSPNNVDYRDNLEKCSSLYQEIKKTMRKFSKLADRRLKKLEEFIRYRSFHEESSQVLSWLCKKGEESLNQYQKLSDSLSAIRNREEEFEEFYFFAMRQIRRGNDLLKEATVMAKGTPTSSLKDDGGDIEEVAMSLRQHLDNFNERLEDTRERFEETAKCYHLLDKCYEWALETMKYVSVMKMDTLSTPDYLEKLVKNLEDYVNNHPPVSDEVFEEMSAIAKNLHNERLLEQCKTARSRCQVTTELVKTRREMLLKAKHQLENEMKGKETPKYRHKSCTQNPWGTQSNVTCLQSLSSSQLYQRHSIATGSPFGLYLSYTNGMYPRLNQDVELNWYLQQKEEQFLNQGLITEDLTTQGPVASIPTSVLEARVGQHSTTPTSIKCRQLEDKINNNSIQEQAKKHNPSQAWQFCEEELEKVTEEVRVQNKRLQKDKNQEEAIDNRYSPENRKVINYPEQRHSSPVFSPVPVNSHLTRPSSLDLSEISSAEDKGKSKKTLMLIMREMIQTERDYVKSLEYIIENYVPELLREDIPQALRGQRNGIFGNIEKIYEFHRQYFLQEIETCESHPFTVGQCFLKYESQFYLYALYNKNKPKSDGLMLEYGTTFFREKQLELSDKMDLASYLLKPVQRMGKYALLLKQLLKECPERDSDHHDLKAAEEMVRFQLRHGNDLLAMDALRECDVNVKEQGRLLRQEEFLVWQGRSKKSFRHLFLFEDLILFSKARRDPERKGFDIYQYKHSIKTTDIGLTEQIGESPTKFEIWFRKRKLQDTYVLQAPNAEIKHLWVQEISKLLWKQALRNREMRLAEMSSMGIGRKPCLDIRPNEDQINDRFVNLHHQLNRGSYYRGSTGMSSFEQMRNKRPHSIISISSSSSSGSSHSSFSLCTNVNLGVESSDSPHRGCRSVTQQSQCSTESGFCTDTSIVGDGVTDLDQSSMLSKPERSDSLLSQDLPSSNFLSLNEEPDEESVSTPM